LPAQEVHWARKVGLLLKGVEKRGFSDAGITRHEDDLRFPRKRLLEVRVELVQRFPAPDQVAVIRSKPVRAGNRAYRVDRTDQPVASPWKRFDIPRLPCVITEPLSYLQYIFLKILRLDESIGPHVGEKFFRRNQVSPAKCQEREEFESLRTQTHALSALPDTL